MASSRQKRKRTFAVGFNPADCDLGFNIGPDGITGSTLHKPEFSYCWAGARGNIGIIEGKYCFGCSIIAYQDVETEEAPDQQYVCRVGISRGDTPVGDLGRTKHSIGFDGTIKHFNDGERFCKGDTILCLVNLESKPRPTLVFCKKGKRLGTVHFDIGGKGASVRLGKEPWASGFFPHVLLKNTVVKLQFSTEHGLVPEEGYKPWASAVNVVNAVLGPQFFAAKDCEVVMMVGLPASGKTRWAEQWVKTHPEKRYILLGTEMALDKMKVPVSSQKYYLNERFGRVKDLATEIVNTLVLRAPEVSRNYVIDQNNIFKSDRRWKLKSFAPFKKVAVVVFPRQQELKLRAEQRYETTYEKLYSGTVYEMLDNFVFPTSKDDMPKTDEDFDEVLFTELSRVKAQQHLKNMQRSLLWSSTKKTSKGDNKSTSDGDDKLTSEGDDKSTSFKGDDKLTSKDDDHSSFTPKTGPGGNSSPLPGHQLRIPGDLTDLFDLDVPANSTNVNIGYTGVEQADASESRLGNFNNVHTMPDHPGYFGVVDTPSEFFHFFDQES